MRRKEIALFISVLFSLHFASAQNMLPKGEFIEDQVKIGEEIIYSLSLEYERGTDILFPDSTFNFSPFEYNSRTYFKTSSDSTQSFDSVIYKLSTFEVDSIQYLQLPIFVLSDEDSFRIYSSLDSIQLIHVISEIPETPEMKANAGLIKLNKQFNYPYLLITIGILLIIVLAVSLFFGKQLLKAWKAYRMKRAHTKFIQRFFNLMRDASSNNPSKTPEHVLAFWKRYLERLEKKPISKLTTKEILVLHSNSTLKENLRTIDRSIYGGEKGNDLFASFDYLMKFSIEVYDQKITELKNG